MEDFRICILATVIVIVAMTVDTTRGSQLSRGHGAAGHLSRSTNSSNNPNQLPAARRSSQNHPVDGSRYIGNVGDRIQNPRIVDPNVPNVGGSRTRSSQGGRPEGGSQRFDGVLRPTGFAGPRRVGTSQGQILPYAGRMNSTTQTIDKRSEASSAHQRGNRADLKDANPEGVPASYLATLDFSSPRDETSFKTDNYPFYASSDIGLQSSINFVEQYIGHIENQLRGHDEDEQTLYAFNQFIHTFTSTAFEAIASADALAHADFLKRIGPKLDNAAALPANLLWPRRLTVLIILLRAHLEQLRPETAKSHQLIELLLLLERRVRAEAVLVHGDGAGVYLKSLAKHLEKVVGKFVFRPLPEPWNSDEQMIYTDVRSTDLYPSTVTRVYPEDRPNRGPANTEYAKAGVPSRTKSRTANHQQLDRSRSLAASARLVSAVSLKADSARSFAQNTISNELYGTVTAANYIEFMQRATTALAKLVKQFSAVLISGDDLEHPKELTQRGNVQLLIDVNLFAEIETKVNRMLGKALRYRLNDDQKTQLNSRLRTAVALSEWTWRYSNALKLSEKDTVHLPMADQLSAIGSQLDKIDEQLVSASSSMFRSFDGSGQYYGTYMSANSMYRERMDELVADEMADRSSVGEACVKVPSDIQYVGSATSQRFKICLTTLSAYDIEVESTLEFIRLYARHIESELQTVSPSMFAFNQFIYKLSDEAEAQIRRAIRATESHIKKTTGLRDPAIAELSASLFNARSALIGLHVLKHSLNGLRSSRYLAENRHVVPNVRASRNHIEWLENSVLSTPNDINRVAYLNTFADNLKQTAADMTLDPKPQCWNPRLQIIFAKYN